MAAQSKTTAVHFSLIFFVMLSVILGVVAYLFYSDYREQQAAMLTQKNEQTRAQTAYANKDKEVQELKRLVGLDLAEVGVTAPGENTVLETARREITRLGTNPSAPSFMAALTDLRNELNNRLAELATRQATIAELQARVEALEGQYGAVAAEHDEKRQQSEQDLAGQQQQFSESVAAKDNEINQLRDQIGSLQTELDQTREQLNAQLARANEEISQLLQRNQQMREELDTIKGESFEVADGEIRSVNQVQRTVWINLGAADNLKPRTTFSVYAKNHAGIGRDNPAGGRPEDIKGSIEVTRILEDHLAEARILDDDSSRPITPGDPIYTPLWSAGRTEKFAFVGMVDVDNDGSFTGDRERLHEIVAAAGAEIASEVNNEGERNPKGRDGEPVRIDESVRFLVVGELPDPLDVPDGPERERLKRIGEQKAAMEEEAHRAGVRIVNLNTFLDYVGYVPQQRRWVPGESTNWNLNAGARGGRRPSSSGSTSGLFDTSRRRPNASTSQTFGR